MPPRTLEIGDLARLSPFYAALETLGPLNRVFSLYSGDLIFRGHPTPLGITARPLYFTSTPVRVKEQHGCFYQTYPSPACAGGLQW